MARTRAADRATRSPSAQPSQVTPTRTRSRRGSSVVPTKIAANAASDTVMPKNGIKRPRRSVSYPILEEGDDKPQDELAQQQNEQADDITAPSSKRPRLSSTIPTPPTTINRKTPGRKKAGASSLLANTHSSPAQPQSSPLLIEERQYTPLRQALDQRSTRRFKRHRLSEEYNDIEAHNKEDAKREKTIRQLQDHIAELELQAEASRMAAIRLNADDEARDAAVEQFETMKAEIEELKKGLAKQEADEQMDDDTQEVDFAIEHEPIFIQPEDLGLSQEDVTSRTSFTVKKRQSRHSFGLTLQPSPAVDPAVESTHKGFEAALNAKAERIAQLESSIESIEIELRNLGFGNGKRQPKYSEILITIHSAFQEARQNVNDLFAEQDLNSVQNGDFLRLLSTSVSELWEEIEVRNHKIEDLEQRQAHLGAQTDKLLVKIAEDEGIIENVHERLQNLDKARDRLDRELVALREDYESLQESSSDKDDQLDSLGQQLDTLQKDHEEQKLVLERQRVEAQSYYDETLRQQETIEFEKRAFEEQLESLRIIMQEKVDALQVQLAQQTTLKNIAEEELSAEIDRAARLDIELGSAHETIESLTAKLESTETLLSQEESRRENAEVKNEKLDEIIASLEADATDLKQAIQTAEGNLELLQVQFDAQTRQREEAETGLDDANEIIAIRDVEISKSRLEANDLKMKLFGVQQERDEQIKSLEGQLESREDEYQNDMQEEVDRRELAEKSVAENNLRITDLEEEISTLESNLDSLSTDKRELEDQFARRSEKLSDQLKDAREEYASLKVESNDQICSLESDVAKLSDRLNQRDVLVRHLEQEKTELKRLLDLEIKQRDETILGLNSQIIIGRDAINNLGVEKAALQDSLESEAAKLQNVILGFEERINTLTTANHGLTQDIAAKDQLATRALTDHRRAIEEKNLIIESLTIVSDGRRTDIEKLHDQNAFLREEVRVLITGRDDAIRNIQRLQQEVYGRVQDEAGQLEVHGQELLARVEELELIPRVREYPAILTTTTTTRRSNGINGHHVEMEEMSVPSSPFRKFTSLLSGSMRTRQPRVSAARSHVHFADGETNGSAESGSERDYSSPIPQ